MGSLKFAAIILPAALFLGSPAFAQSPTYGLGRTPSAQEISARDINIGDDYARLPDWKHGTPRLEGYPY